MGDTRQNGDRLAPGTERRRRGRPGFPGPAERGRDLLPAPTPPGFVSAPAGGPGPTRPGASRVPGARGTERSPRAGQCGRSLRAPAAPLSAAAGFPSFQALVPGARSRCSSSARRRRTCGPAARTLLAVAAAAGRHLALWSRPVCQLFRRPGELPWPKNGSLPPGLGVGYVGCWVQGLSHGRCRRWPVLSSRVLLFHPSRSADVIWPGKSLELRSRSGVATRVGDMSWHPCHGMGARPPWQGTAGCFVREEGMRWAMRLCHCMRVT